MSKSTPRSLTSPKSPSIAAPTQTSTPAKPTSSTTHSDLRHLRNIAPTSYHYNFATILQGLTRTDVFPVLDIAGCMRRAHAGGLHALSRAPECQEIISFFHNQIGLQLSVGYNPGTGLISLKFPLPTRKFLREPFSSFQQALLWCALGLPHYQQAFEADFIRLQRDYYILQQKHNILQPFDIVQYALRPSLHRPTHLGRGQLGCVETINNIIQTNDVLKSCSIPVSSHELQMGMLEGLLLTNTSSSSSSTPPSTSTSTLHTPSTTSPTPLKQSQDVNTPFEQKFSNNNCSNPEHHHKLDRTTPKQLISLGNLCLYTFFRQSQLLISDIIVNMDQQQCTLIVRPAKFNYVMQHPPKSGAPHPLNHLLSFSEITSQMNDIEYNIITQYQQYQDYVEEHHELSLPLPHNQLIENNHIHNHAHNHAHTHTHDADCEHHTPLPTTTTALPLPVSTSTSSQEDDDDNSIPEHTYNRYYFDFSIPIYKSDDSIRPYTYSPIYTLTSGYNPMAFKRDPKYLQEQKKYIIKALQQYFWFYITSIERYYPTPVLKQNMNLVLERWFETGLNTVRCGFNPKLENLSLFLWGTAGTGKSTFVRVLCATLYTIIDQIFEPGKRVEITRMPFNQTSPDALAALLMVRGISDWSLERIVEQTVSRGGLSLLHLEEQPPDPIIQNKLYALITRMTTALVHRYPEYRHNVINLLTANYPPSKELALTTNVIEIQPPNKLTQQIWICKTAEDMIASNLLELDPGIARQSFSLLEQTPLVQFVSHPNDKPPFVISTWSNDDSTSSSMESHRNGGSDGNNANNLIAAGLKSLPHLSHTFHTTIQRPLYSISARLNEAEFEHNFMNEYYQHHPEASSIHDTPGNFIAPFVSNLFKSIGLSATTASTFSSQKGDNGRNNNNSNQELFIYPPLLPFLKQYHTEVCSVACAPHRDPMPTTITPTQLIKPIEPTTTSSPLSTSASASAYLQFNLHIELISPPPFTYDLRKLEGWKRSVSYAILQHLISHLTICVSLCGLISSSPFCTAQRNSANPSTAHGGDIVMTTQYDRIKHILPQTIISLAFSAQIKQVKNKNSDSWSIMVEFDSYDHIGFRRRATLSHEQYQQYQRRQQSHQYKQHLLKQANPLHNSQPTTNPLIKNTQTVDNLLTLLPPLKLLSDDGYFFHVETPSQSLFDFNLHEQQQERRAAALNKQYSSNIIKSSPKAPFSDYRDPKLPLTSFERSRIHAIIAMWKSLFLQPAVIVLAGPPKDTSKLVKYIHNLIQTQCLIPEINHFPTQEHITTKDNALFPSINTNLTYSDSLKVEFNANHFQQQQNSQQFYQKSCPNDDCLVSPPFAYQTFLDVVRSGNNFISDEIHKSKVTQIQEEQISSNEDTTLSLSSQSFNNQDLQPLAQQFVVNPKRRYLPPTFDSLADDQIAREVPELFQFYAIAHNEQHKHMLFGEPDPSRSILTRFITQVQTHHIPKVLSSSMINPLSSKSSHNTLTAIGADESHLDYQHVQIPRALGVIFASTNGPGQFYFRDLIDTGESNTHVTKTHKDGLLFVLVIDNTRPSDSITPSQVAAEEADGDLSSIYAVQPQVISRSHIVISLPNDKNAPPKSPAKL